MKRIDSPLWTNAAPTGPGPFSHLTIPDNLEEIAAQVAIDCADEIRRRTAQYETRITWATLMRPLCTHA